MAKTEVQTLSPDLIREVLWAVNQVKRLVKGELSGEIPEPAKAPDGYVAKTPAGGIPARVGRTITAVYCPIYREVPVTPGLRGGNKTLTRIKDDTGAAFSLPIYNVHCVAVPGGEFVPTALLKSGTRYAVAWQDCESESSSSSSSSSPPPSSSSSSSPPPSSSSSSPPPSSSSSSSPPPSSSETQSSKSTAIVPAAWSPGGYAALYVAEMPDVRFDELLTATISERTTYVPIDPRYIDVCEPDSIQVCGLVPARPLSLGASIEAGGVRIVAGRRPAPPCQVVIRLSGIRRGFAGARFSPRTRDQFLANERFLRSAYPGAGDE